MWTQVKKLVLLFLVNLVLLNLAGCSGTAAGETVTVETAAATKGRVAAELEVTGALVPDRVATVSARLPGQVAEVKAEIGDKVKAGQLLVRIDTKELQAQLKQAEAALAAVRDKAELARINLDSAQKFYERIKALADAGAASESQLDEARTRLDTARNQYESAAGSGLAQAEAAVNIIKVNISNALVTSPLSGTVTNRNINPGETASPGIPLMTVADTSALKLQGTVAQEVVPLITAGQEVKVSVDVLPGREFTGRVTQVGPVAVATGQRFPLEVSINNNEGELKAGMTARAVFRLTGPEGVVVPLAAVRTEGGQDYVFVIKDGKAVKRPVTLGLKGTEQVTVLKGLDEGEKVAVSYVGILQDGMEVAVK